MQALCVLLGAVSPRPSAQCGTPAVGAHACWAEAAGVPRDCPQVAAIRVDGKTGYVFDSHSLLPVLVVPLEIKDFKLLFDMLLQNVNNP